MCANLSQGFFSNLNYWVLDKFLMKTYVCFDQWMEFMQWLFARGSLKFQKMVKNALNGNFSNLRINICFQRNLNEPIIYLESWVDRNKKICHQILHVTSSSGGISSMKIEFFSSKAEKHANIQTFQRIQT